MCSTLSPHMALKRTCSSSGITSQLELSLPHICTSVSSLRASASRIWSSRGQSETGMINWYGNASKKVFFPSSENKIQFGWRVDYSTEFSWAVKLGHLKFPWAVHKPIGDKRRLRNVHCLDMSRKRDTNLWAVLMSCRVEEREKLGRKCNSRKRVEHPDSICNIKIQLNTILRGQQWTAWADV